MAGEIRAAVATLDDIARRLDSLALDGGVDRRRSLITLRRELGVALEDLTRAVHSDGGDEIAPAVLSIARTRVSCARHAIALHQASWSAVLIDTDPASYRNSAEAALAALRDCLAWIRQNVS